MMNKSEIEYIKNHQQAYDHLSASCNASTAAEQKFRILFNKIVQRGINDKYQDGKDDTTTDLNNVYFIATDDESKLLRDLYCDWQAYKVIWQEDDDKLMFLKIHGKVLDSNERVKLNNAKEKINLWHKAYKYIYKLTLLTASITVIVKFAF
jgi:hypothetical protein